MHREQRWVVPTDGCPPIEGLIAWVAERGATARFDRRAIRVYDID